MKKGYRKIKLIVMKGLESYIYAEPMGREMHFSRYTSQGLDTLCFRWLEHGPKKFVLYLDRIEKHA